MRERTEIDDIEIGRVIDGRWIDEEKTENTGDECKTYLNRHYSRQFKFYAVRVPRGSIKLALSHTIS